MKGYLKIIVIGLCLINFYLAKNAFAAFDISVRPYEGGYDLRFGKVSNIGLGVNKEVVVNITSDIGKQYRLIQTLLEPLTNAQGISISQSNFLVYGIRGTNKYGTLSVEQEIPVSLGRTITYTSSPQGLSDSFNLVYVLKGPFDVPAGSYRGRIAFILEPIDATQAPVTVILNIFAEIEIESSVEIKTITGSKVISLSSCRQETLSFDVLVDIKGGLGSQFRILQLLSQALESGEGERLPYEAVNFQIREAKRGSGPTQLIPLSPGQEVLYTSGPRGEPDSFIITYSLAETEKQKAGRYKTKIRYIIEGLAGQNVLQNLDFEVEIARVFDLIVKPEMGGIIEFRDLKPQQPPKQSEVLIEINTNIGRQYQVSQKLLSELVSKEGQVIPTKYFTLRQEGLGTKGTLKFPSPVEVKAGDTVLFISDKEGSPDSFKIIYELNPSLDLRPGDYSTRIVYSISEI